MFLSAAAAAAPLAGAFVANPSAGSSFTRQTMGAMRGGSSLCAEGEELRGNWNRLTGIIKRRIQSATLLLLLLSTAPLDRFSVLQT